MHAVLLEPYPYRDSERLVHLRQLLNGKVFLELQKLDALDGAIATDFYNMILTEAIFRKR